MNVQIASQFLPGGAAAGTYSDTILFESADSTVSSLFTLLLGLLDLAPSPVRQFADACAWYSVPVVQIANVASTTTSKLTFFSIPMLLKPQPGAIRFMASTNVLNVRYHRMTGNRFQ